MIPDCKWMFNKFMVHFPLNYLGNRYIPFVNPNIHHIVSVSLFDSLVRWFKTFISAAWVLFIPFNFGRTCCLTTKFQGGVKNVCHVWWPSSKKLHVTVTSSYITWRWRHGELWSLHVASHKTECWSDVKFRKKQSGASETSIPSLSVERNQTWYLWAGINWSSAKKYLRFVDCSNYLWDTVALKGARSKRGASFSTSFIKMVTGPGEELGRLVFQTPLVFVLFCLRLKA